MEGQGLGNAVLRVGLQQFGLGCAGGKNLGLGGGCFVEAGLGGRQPLLLVLLAETEHNK